MNEPRPLEHGVSEALLSQCLRHRIVPLAMDDAILQIALETVLPLTLETELNFICNRQIQPVYWPRARLDEAIYQLQRRKPDTSLNDIAADYQALQEQKNDYLSSESDDEPVVRFVNQTLQQAIQRRASDIHFEPYANTYRIRLRIDGVLQQVSTPPPALAARIVARLKIMAQLNIAERRLPQDGQLSLKIGDRRYAMRLASLPVAAGEKIVLRIMESDQQSLDISALGMSAELQQQYSHALYSPQGLILVTGPTGSGKTVTLYSGLSTLNGSERNICSVEDPIEIELNGINQTQVNVKTGLIFSQALRAFLRQDPDVIMVGEIRDKETAEIALTAAQTGHLVLSTLHTNSTTDSLIRLSQMGIANYLIAASLKLIVAQRLLRRLCNHCRQPQKMLTEVFMPDGLRCIQEWWATGCEHCVGGYYGRIGIYEMLRVTAEMKTALLDNCPQNELQALACRQGMIPLFNVGITLVDQGKTSLKELYRILGEQAEMVDLVASKESVDRHV